MKVTGLNLVVQALKANGVETAFTLTNDHTSPLTEAVAAEGIRLIDTGHERAAIGAAIAWGRVSGEPGVCLFSAEGYSNAIPGLTMAEYMGSPVISIVSSEAGDSIPAEMAESATRGAWTVADPSRIPEFLAKAFMTATSVRRGPVHITIPINIQKAEIDEVRVRSVGPDEYRDTEPAPGGPDLVKAAVEILKEAQRPMAVAGNGAFSVSRQSMERLVETVHLPLFTDEGARGILPDSHLYCFGPADGRVNPVATYLRDADVVLLLGKKLDFTLSYGGPPSLAPDVKIIQVDQSLDQNAPPRGVDLAIAGDVGSVVDQLTDEAEEIQWGEHPMLGELESAGESLEHQLEAFADESGELHAMSVHQALRPLLDDEACLIFDDGDFPSFGMAYHPSQSPGRWITNGALGTIGWGVPFAMGAQLAAPDAKVVVLTGDGAFGFLGMEIDNAARHNLPVIVIMCNDAVWGMDQQQQADLYWKPVETQLLTTRYDKLAEAVGAHGEFVEEAHQLPGALERAFSAGRPALVNIRITSFPSPLSEHFIDVRQDR